MQITRIALLLATGVLTFSAWLLVRPWDFLVPFDLLIITIQSLVPLLGIVVFLSTFVSAPTWSLAIGVGVAALRVILIRRREISAQRSGCAILSASNK